MCDEESILDRMVRAVELVRERLFRTTTALESGGIPYAVAGGNAVAYWVATVDRGAVRNTPDVDILINRADFEAARQVMAEAGFDHQTVDGIEMFLDGPDCSVRSAVHLLFAHEKVRPNYCLPSPSLNNSVFTCKFVVLNLDSLVTMKLVSYRMHDQVHIDDLISVGLVDDSWLERFTGVLRDRLQHLLDTPGQ